MHHHSLVSMVIFIAPQVGKNDLKNCDDKLQHVLANYNQQLCKQACLELPVSVLSARAKFFLKFTLKAAAYCIRLCSPRTDKFSKASFFVHTEVKLTD